MITIMVTGANGQVGNAFQKIADQYNDYQFFFFGKDTLDIQDSDSLKSTIHSLAPDYIINCAAYTAVDRAEDEKEKAFAINSHAVETLGSIIADKGIKLVHFSSDYVFHLDTTQALKEDDLTSPKGVYAESKLKSEEVIRSFNIPALILRTSWVYASSGHNFIRTMLRLSESNSEIKVVNDQIGTPTYADDIAICVMIILNQLETRKCTLDDFNQTYNFSNEGVTNWFEYAKKIFELSKKEITVIPVSSHEYPTKAQRPKWSVLSKDKIKQTFGLKIPHWQTSLEKCLEEILH